MKIEKYGITLSSLQREDLELVRSWRNSDFIKNQMLFRETISEEMQQTWFESLNHSSIYLMIESNDEKIGLINIKEIDWEKRSGEAGIFIGSAKHRNTMIPILAILALMDNAFEQLQFRSLTAKVIKHNRTALDMNLELGYRIAKEQLDYFELQLTATDYNFSTTSLKSKINRLVPNRASFKLNKEEKDYFSLLQKSKAF